MRLNTFLNFGGNCEQAFRFYEQHLGGKITMMMRRAEQPDQPVTWPGWEQSIQYAIMEIGETQLMGSDVPPDRFQPMRSVYLSLTVNGATKRNESTSCSRTAGRYSWPWRRPSLPSAWAAPRQVRYVLDDSRLEAADFVTAGREVFHYGPRSRPTYHRRSGGG